MKQGFKLLTVVLFTLLLAAGAAAQINWLKQDGGLKYLAWDDGSNGKTINNGNTATFTTGYFGSTISKKVTLTATINNKDDGKIVNTLVSKKVNVADTLGYEVITILPEHYNDKAGEYIIVIKIKDANTELVDSSLYLKVEPFIIKPIFIPEPDSEPFIPIFLIPINLNDAPEMDHLDDKEVKENSNLQFTFSAADADDDKLTYEAKASVKLGNYYLSLPVSLLGVSFDSDTGKFSWTPDYDFVKHPFLSKAVDFRFRADDGEKKSAWQLVTVTVNDVNRKPQFNPIGNKIVQEQQLLEFTVNAVDADHDDLTYTTMDSLPPGAVFDPESRQFEWAPTNDKAGIYFVSFKVVDGFGGEDLERISILVTDLPAEEPQCSDGIDNDGDGLIDENDPGCHTDGNKNNPGSYDPEDNDETDPVNTTAQCKDGIDNDGDGKTDFPADPGCIDENDNDETDEPAEEPQCKDGIDNDGDGKVDFPADPGCTDELDNDETDESAEEPQCKDGIDNDRDGKVDMQDPGCASQEDDDESNNDTPQPNPVPYTNNYTNIKIKTAHIEDLLVTAGELMDIQVNIFNNGKTDLKDVEVQATIYEIGAFGSTSDFDLPKSKGASRNVYVYVPEEVQPGWYLVKITAKNYHYHTSTYRLAYIGGNTFQ